MQQTKTKTKSAFRFNFREKRPRPSWTAPRIDTPARRANLKRSLELGGSGAPSYQWPSTGVAPILQISEGRTGRSAGRRATRAVHCARLGSRCFDLNPNFFWKTFGPGATAELSVGRARDVGSNLIQPITSPLAQAHSSFSLPIRHQPPIFPRTYHGYYL